MFSLAHGQWNFPESLYHGSSHAITTFPLICLADKYLVVLIYTILRTYIKV